MSLTGANHKLLEPLTKGYAYKWLNVCTWDKNGFMLLYNKLGSILGVYIRYDYVCTIKRKEIV